MSDALTRIAALLRQAETTTNDNEADAYMRKAQMLATATSIDLEIARQHQANKEKRETPIQKKIVIGERGKKGLKHYVNLFLGIGKANDVKCNIAHNSTYVIAFGFPSDIEVTETLYASVLYQMVEASDKYLRSGEYKNESSDNFDYKNMCYKPIDGRVARNNFQDAFQTRIAYRLTMARHEAVEAAKAAERDAKGNDVPESAQSSTELVIRNKEIELTDFYKQNSNARGSWSGGRSTGQTSYGSRSAGRNAGDRARLSSATAIGGSRTAIG